MRNLHQLFVLCTASQIVAGDFATFCGLLRIYELYCLIIPGLVIILLANTVTALSAISMSAIATNGQIAGGGVYYMISRALGPALGGSIGLMFTMANIISVATYTIGFSESLLDLLADVIPTWDGM